MKICTIEYRLRKSDRFMRSIRVHIISQEKAIKMARIQNAYEYSVTEFAHPLKLGYRYYSPKLGTYNALWLTQEGKPAYWGSYNPDDGSYCLYYDNTRLALGTWYAGRFETYGHYGYNEVRKAIQRGFV